MKNKNLTAVDWLVEQFNLQAYIPHIQQAKQMEKEQIKEAFKFGVHEGYLTDINYLNCDDDAEYYYNETYG